MVIIVLYNERTFERDTVYPNLMKMHIKWNDVLLEVVMQKEINLKVLFDIIKKRLSLILIITAITTILSGIYGVISAGPPPIYQSSASILLNMDKQDDMNALEVILRDPAVLNQVIQELGLKTSVDDLNKQITFSNDGGKIVKIMATDTNPELAANITNSTAYIFTKQVGNILGYLRYKNSYRRHSQVAHLL